MSDVANNQQNGAVDDYFGSGKNYTLKSGVNKDVKVKSWSIESNERDGKTSYYLKLVYVHPQQGVDPEEWSTINELINFPGVRLNKTEVDKNTLKYGFINPLRGFIENFASTDEVKERFVAVLGKLGIKDFDLVDTNNLNKQLETLVRGWFDLAEKKGLYQLEGTLVCGYGTPKQSGDEIKQYLTPAKYGAQGCYKPAFRTNNDEELPAEKTDGFSSDSDKKYNYWSYTRTKKESTSVAQESAPTVDTGGW